MTERQTANAANHGQPGPDDAFSASPRRAPSKESAVATIHDYLTELRAVRPTVTLSAARSAKGARTLRDILQAANAVFVRDGHAGLSLRKVADETGVAVGNISYYFPSKRALLEAMLKEALADYVEAHLEQFEADRDSPLDILLNVVVFYVSNGRQSHRLFYQIWGYAGSDATALELIRDLYRPIGRFVHLLVRAANPALDDRRARQVVLQIFSLEEGLKLFMGMGPPGDPALASAEEDIRELTKRIVLGA